MLWQQRPTKARAAWLPEIGGAFSYSGQVKPALTLAQQVALLRQRGLVVADEAAAQQFLYDANYYRVSGYARQFQRDPRSGDDAFEAGITIERLQHIFDLDVQLSTALARCLGLIERSVRARFAYELAHACGSGAFYLDPASYLAVMPYRDQFLDKLYDELRRTRSPTVARYVEGDEDFSAVPVWVAFELFSFSAVSRILEYLADRAPRDAVAASYSEQKGLFPSTIHSLAVLRNRCAHHGQLWHRRLTIQTPEVKKARRHEPRFDPQGLYPAILAIRRLLGHVRGGDAALEELNAVVSSVPELRDGILNPSPR